MKRLLLIFLLAGCSKETILVHNYECQVYKETEAYWNQYGTFCGKFVCDSVVPVIYNDQNSNWSYSDSAIIKMQEIHGWLWYGRIIKQIN